MGALNVELARRRCRACGGLEDRLSRAAVEQYLTQVSSEWRLSPDGHHVEREVVLRDFAEAIAFVNRVAAVAEEQNHHPDITIRAWNRVVLTQFTYVAQGLTESDFIMAAKYDELVQQRVPS